MVNPALALRPLWRALRGCALAIGFTYLAVSCSPVIVDTWAAALAGPWRQSQGSTLVVLGANVLGDGTIGDSSYWRAVYSKRAWEEAKATRVIYSGAVVSGAMRDFAVAIGVPRDRTEVEGLSTSTRENAIEVAKLLAGQSGGLVLVTSDYHMYRAARVFRRLGMDVGTYPLPDARKRVGAWQGRWAAFVDLVTETAKIAYYALRGWI